MKKLLMMALMLSATAGFAGTTTQKWTAGWDNFGEPLNYTKSKVAWSVNATSKKLTVTYTLVSAIPGKLYQVDLAFFCSTFASTFGQFPVQGLNGNACQTIMRQNVTASAAYAELGVVTTDLNGNGVFAVSIGPIAAGTYKVEFRALDGAGCDLTGGAGGNGSDCDADFQSPGPFGTTTTIVIP
jgi:hypothetical protein